MKAWTYIVGGGGSEIKKKQMDAEENEKDWEEKRKEGHGMAPDGDNRNRHVNSMHLAAREHCPRCPSCRL